MLRRAHWGSGSVYFNDYRWQHSVTESMNVGAAVPDPRRPGVERARGVLQCVQPEVAEHSVCKQSDGDGDVQSVRAADGGFGYIAWMSGARNGQLVARIQF